MTAGTSGMTSEATESFALKVSTGVLPVSLFAGGSTGLLLVDTTATSREQWLELALRGEEDGLSSLVFAAPLPSVDQEGAVRAAAELLRNLGIDCIMLVAAGKDAFLGLQLAGRAACEALVLLTPTLKQSQTGVQAIRAARLPKLVLVGSTDDEGQAAAQMLRRRAIGPIILRHVPASDRGAALISSDHGELVVDTILTFAIRLFGREDFRL